jgi:hypothetical protein
MAGSPTPKNHAIEQIIRYLVGRPGSLENYNDIAEAVGADQSAVNAALARAVREHPEYGIRREARGTYVFRPNLVTETHTSSMTASLTSAGMKVGDLLEVVGMGADGTVVVRDEISKTLYRIAAI